MIRFIPLSQWDNHTMPSERLSIEVEPQYLPEQSQPLQEVYGFAYTVTVRNTGHEPAQLVSRHWVITDDDGQVEEVKGLGVVGHQPFLKPGEQFRYSSGCRLRTPGGNMHGTFYFLDEEGERFGVTVPMFVLDASGLPKPVV
jgi:ApaG protein